MWRRCIQRRKGSKSPCHSLSCAVWSTPQAESNAKIEKTNIANINPLSRRALLIELIPRISFSSSLISLLDGLEPDDIPGLGSMSRASFCQVPLICSGVNRTPPIKAPFSQVFPILLGLI
jgi:hypothetical protein